MVTTFLTYCYAFVAVTLLVVFIKRTYSSHLPAKNRILKWTLFGILWNAFSLTWLFSPYPIHWLLPGVTQLLGIFIFYLTMTIGGGVVFGVVGFLDTKKLHRQVIPCVFALLLSAAEIFRSLLLSLMLSGNGGRVGLHWIGGSLGNALSITPFVEYAYFGGTYMLAFVLGYLVYICYSKINIRLYRYHLALFFVTLFVIHFSIPVPTFSKPLTVSVIATNFPIPNEKIDMATQTDVRNHTWKKHHNMTTSFAKDAPDIIVYPEGAKYTDSLTPLANTELLSLFKNTLLIDGTTRKFDSGYSNYSAFYEIDTHTLTGRGKSLLLFFNEYIPTIYMPFISLFVGKENMEAFASNHTYIPRRQMSVHMFDTLRIGTLLCSEISSYQTVQSLHSKKPDIVFYQSYLSVFHDSHWYAVQNKMMAKTAAATLRTSVISASNGAQSFIISPYGDVVDTIATGFSTSTYTLHDNTITKVH